QTVKEPGLPIAVDNRYRNKKERAEDLRYSARFFYIDFLNIFGYGIQFLIKLKPDNYEKTFYTGPYFIAGCCPQCLYASTSQPAGGGIPGEKPEGIAKRHQQGGTRRGDGWL